MQGIYINLNSRSDRVKHFENLKDKFPFLSEINRMSAIEHSDGAIGCCMSHIQALCLLEKTDAPFIAIFEDDFCVFDNDAFGRFICDFEKIKDVDHWKIIVLTPRGTSIESKISNFKRVINNQTATGYIIKKDMIPILIKNFSESLQLQLKQTDKNICACDQYWKRLQQDYPFYYYKDIFGGQLEGWSNIEGRNVDYNERFKLQNLF